MPYSSSDPNLFDAVAAAVAARKNAVTAVREFIGYTVEDLALTSGLATLEITEIERGSYVDPVKIHRIAVALRLADNVLLHS